MILRARVGRNELLVQRLLGIVEELAREKNAASAQHKNERTTRTNLVCAKSPHVRLVFARGAHGDARTFGFRELNSERPDRGAAAVDEDRLALFERSDVEERLVRGEASDGESRRFGWGDVLRADGGAIGGHFGVLCKSTVAIHVHADYMRIVGAPSGV